MKWVKEFQDTDHIIGQLLVTNVTKGVTDKGMNYINITLQDKTGSIEAKKWDATDEDMRTFVPGTIINVEGIVGIYKNAPQMKILSATPVKNLEEVNLVNFQKVSPIPLEDMKKKLDMYMNSFKDEDVKLITTKVIEHFYDKYISYPAAVKIHHEFASGILHHSLAMADLAESIAKLYPQVDRDLLIAGTLLHDIGKTIEYENPLMPKQTLEGKLHGHISIMYAEFKKIVDPLNIKSEVPTLLGHMILAHHGKLEWGSPVMPCTREAILLSMIDLIDSRMMILDKLLDGMKPGEFSSKQYILDDICVYKPQNK